MHTDFSLAGQQSLSYSAAEKISIDLSTGFKLNAPWTLAGLDIDLPLHAGGKIDIATAFNLFLEMKLGVCFGLDIDARAVGMFKMTPDISFQILFPGVELKTKPLLDFITKSPLETRLDGIEAKIKSLEAKL